MPNDIPVHGLQGSLNVVQDLVGQSDLTINTLTGSLTETGALRGAIGFTEIAGYSGVDTDTATTRVDNRLRTITVNAIGTMPTGGAPGTILTKVTADDYDAVWSTYSEKVVFINLNTTWNEIMAYIAQQRFPILKSEYNNYTIYLPYSGYDISNNIYYLNFQGLIRHDNSFYILRTRCRDNDSTWESVDRTTFDIGAIDSILDINSGRAVTNAAISAALATKQNLLTQAQIAAINSGISSELVSNIEAHLSNTSAHVSQQDRNNWNSKVTAYRNANGSLVLTTQTI